MAARLDLSSGLKTCTACGTEKAVSEFYANSRPGGFSRCKTCVLTTEAERRSRPGEQESARARQLRWHLKHHYDITMDDYKALLADQSGLCAICGQPESALGRGGAVKPLAVDHNHKSGAVRGLLCHRCNSVLGNAQDDPERLEAAAQYLRRAEPFPR